MLDSQVGLVVVVTVCCLGSAIGPVAAAHGSPASTGVDVANGSATPTVADAADAPEDQGAPAASSQITLTQTLVRTPDRPGSFDARNRYRVPEAVRSLEVTVPREATVLEADGFVDQGGERFVWNGATVTPTIRLRMPANRTTDRDDPLAGPGNYIFVDTGDWGIVQRPSLGHSWGWQGGTRVAFDRTLQAEPGVAGDAMAYLGEYEERTNSANGQTVRLIVPEDASMAEAPERVFDDLAYGSRALQVGDRDDEVLAIVAPTEGIQWGVRGLQTGSADMWVRDVETVDTVDNVWLHEYVHTRQGYRTAPDARWFTEATATYYAALLTLERDRIEFEAFRERLARGEATARFADVRLAEPTTWQNNPDYHVGALTAAQLDRQLRVTSANERTLQDVFRSANEADSVVDGASLRGFVRDAGGEATASEVDRYVTTTQRPQMWTIDEHGAAFGTLPARIGVRVADVERPVRISGEYRDRRVETPPVIVPGERLEVDVEAGNAGGTAGTFDASLRVGTDVVDRRGGRLGPGESTTLTVGGTLEAPGQYDVQVADQRYPVEVREPTRASVTGIEVDRTSVQPGEQIEVTATLDNDAAWPGERDLAVTTGTRILDEQTVRLDAREDRRVRTTVTIDEPGRHELAVRGSDLAPVTVSVAGDSVDDGTPGFGLGVALLAILVGSVLLGRERR